MEQLSYSHLTSKWADLLDAEKAGGVIEDTHKRNVTAALLENTEKSFTEAGQSGMLNEAAPGNNTGSAANWNPVLMSLVRRSAPNLMAYELAGVQPMTGPTGLIFAMKSRYGAGSTGSTEALFNEADTRYSGTQTATPDNSQGASGLDGVADSGTTGTLDDDRVTNQYGTGMATDSAEALGTTGSTDYAEMGFTIEKATVTATSRALKGEYTIELAQDLKAIHGADAETELANILTTELLAEMNREIIRTINSQAKTGCLTANTAINGVFNLSTDADGRWSAEKFKGLGVQIDREANVIAKETRRGKGNVIVCSSDVATALHASGMLDYSPALATKLNVDDTGNTFAGVFNGKVKVYIDPYASADYVTVGYKGSHAFDAGVFYCPYVPLTMQRAQDPNSFQPKIGFKTRYGMVSNPFVGSTPSNGLAAAKTNQYYRIFRVDGFLV